MVLCLLRWKLFTLYFCSTKRILISQAWCNNKNHKNYNQGSWILMEYFLSAWHVVMGLQTLSHLMLFKILKGKYNCCLYVNMRKLSFSKVQPRSDCKACMINGSVHSYCKVTGSVTLAKLYNISGLHWFIRPSINPLINFFINSFN